MADPFVIYTLGDTALFYGALNGIAMLFSDTDLLSGDGYLNLGYGAYFGAMILLCVMVYNAAFKQQFELRALLAPLIVYIVLTVPKVDVAVYDVQSTSSMKVSNIPIGLAIPASVASGISKVLTVIFETAYQTVNNNEYYMPRITEDGFVTPLKLINSLREVASISPSPLFIESTKNFYQKCLYQNPAFNPTELSQSDDALKYIGNVARSNSDVGGVLYMSLSANGGVDRRIMTCPQAAKAIEDNLYGYVDGVKVKDNEPNMMGDVSVYNLKRALNEQLAASGGLGGATGKLYDIHSSDTTTSDMYKAFANLAGLQESEARKYVASTLLNPVLKTAAFCAEKYGAASNLSKCTAWVSSTNQWEEKNAAAATGFLRVMKDGQNILIMLSFLLFPIIVIFIMIQGTGSFKILGNYMAFTVAAYLWLPLATLINFYTQTTLSEEYFKISSANGHAPLNMVTGPQFYAAVSQKLSLANGMLASVPILSMMLFSGMMMGISALSGRMNSADGGEYDAKVNNPDLLKSSPIAATNSAVSDNGAGVFKIAGQSGFSTNYTNSLSAAKTHTDSISKSQQERNENVRSLLGQLSSNISKGESVNSSQQNSDSSQEVITEGKSKSDSGADTKTLGTNNSNQFQVAEGLQNASADIGSVVGTGQISGQGNVLASKKNSSADGKSNDKAFNVGASGGGSRVWSGLDSSGQIKEISKNEADTVGAKYSENLVNVVNNLNNKGEGHNYSKQEVESLTKAINADEKASKEVTASGSMGQSFAKINNATQQIADSRSQLASISLTSSSDTDQLVSRAESRPEQYKDLLSTINGSSDQDKEKFQEIKSMVTPQNIASKGGNDVAGNILAASLMGGEIGQKAANLVGGGHTNNNYNQISGGVDTSGIKPKEETQAKVDKETENVEKNINNAKFNTPDAGRLTAASKLNNSTVGNLYNEESQKFQKGTIPTTGEVSKGSPLVEPTPAPKPTPEPTPEPPKNNPADQGASSAKKLHSDAYNRTQPR